MDIQGYLQVETTYINNGLQGIGIFTSRNYIILTMVYMVQGYLQVETTLY